MPALVPDCVTAIDPSVDDAKTGWARFERGQLVGCGLRLPDILAGHVVIEVPEYRRNSTKRVNPNDLIKLAVRVGELAATSRVFWFASTQLVTPTEWKGNTPKDIHGLRIIRALSLKELAVYEEVKCAASLRHNVVDAIGLGLWRVGRLSR